MKPIIFYDTETTGRPDWKSPSDSEIQPHLVQLGAIMADEESREVFSTIDLIIKPDNWEIPAEVSEVHGITTEKAKAYGIDEKLALEIFFAFTGNCTFKRVAHNRTFDQRIIRIASKRYQHELMEAWADKDNHDCTMLLSKPVLQLEPKGRYGFKSPKLSEAYEHFTGKQLENEHTAMADAKACMEVYWGLMDLQKKAAA